MRPISIGAQDFEMLRMQAAFYVDKTDFIREWWNNLDPVTLITRPRRFGKTLTMSMVNCFFSVRYRGKGEKLFQKLAIWKNPEFRKIQGTYPVVFLSFANVKETTYEKTVRAIKFILWKTYKQFEFLVKSDLLSEDEKAYFSSVTPNMDDETAKVSISTLCGFLERYYEKKVILLLDEYDTPLQEAYVDEYWDDLTSFTRGLFNDMFKNNMSLERGLMTGITRISKESIFSDLNNLVVITTTSEDYATSFGFTEQEVAQALEDAGLADQIETVRKWYDGFTFGSHPDIYNPWSITCFLKYKKYRTYWADTSSNVLAGTLIRKGNNSIKQCMEDLLDGKSLKTQMDEQIVYSQLETKESAVWSLLLASGYLRVRTVREDSRTQQLTYELALTDLEVELMFETMIRDWFDGQDTGYNEFLKALLHDDVKAMNVYMNQVSEDTFSTFDSGTRPSESRPERFWHGFVLGLLVGLKDYGYEVKSNRESGFGRYDVAIIPNTVHKNAYILEFKVREEKSEKSLRETGQTALKQIRDRDYDRDLQTRGFCKDQIVHYGFAFQGKKVLIAAENADS